MRPTREYKEAMLERVGKQIYFPDVEKFSDLFDDWRLWEHGRSEGFDRIPIKVRQSAYQPEGSFIGEFCSVACSGLGNLHVKPGKRLIDFILKQMVIPNYDVIDFELIDRTDGMLVLAKNNVIIGSRWLALLPPSALQEIESHAKLVLKKEA